MNGRADLEKGIPSFTLTETTGDEVRKTGEKRLDFLFATVRAIVNRTVEQVPGQQGPGIRLNRHHFIGETADVQTDIGFAGQKAAPLITDSDDRLPALKEPQKPGNLDRLSRPRNNNHCCIGIALVSIMQQFGGFDDSRVNLPGAETILKRDGRKQRRTHSGDEDSP
jgi:hypothetical protein